MVFGIYAFLFGLSISFGNLGLNQALPLGDIQGVIVKNNFIYIGLGYYHKIVVFSTKGEFVKSWNTNTYGKRFNFELDRNDTPVAEVYFPTAHIYDNEVNEILSRAGLENTKLETFNKQMSFPKEFITDDGVVYRVEGVLLRDIVKVKDGEKQVLYSQGILKGLMNAPYVPLFVILGGILSLIVLNGKIIKFNISTYSGMFFLTKTMNDIWFK